MSIRFCLFHVILELSFVTPGKDKGEKMTILSGDNTSGHLFRFSGLEVVVTAAEAPMVW